MLAPLTCATTSSHQTTPHPPSERPPPSEAPPLLFPSLLHRPWLLQKEHCCPLLAMAPHCSAASSPRPACFSELSGLMSPVQRASPPSTTAPRGPSTHHDLLGIRLEGQGEDPCWARSHSPGEKPYLTPGPAAGVGQGPSPLRGGPALPPCTRSFLRVTLGLSP